MARSRGGRKNTNMIIPQILRNDCRLKDALVAFPETVQSVVENDVVIRFSAKTGDKIDTHLGPACVFLEDEQVYELDIVERKAGLFRIGGLISRFGGVDGRTMTIDCRYPSGSETQTCDAAVEKVSDKKTMKKKTGE
jgi:hypothetical protein